MTGPLQHLAANECFGPLTILPLVRHRLVFYLPAPHIDPQRDYFAFLGAYWVQFCGIIQPIGVVSVIACVN
jgi:hypothetical protein